MLKIIQRLLEPKDNGPEAATLLAELLQVKVTGATLAKEIQEHPDNRSLLSISDVLKNYGIDNCAIPFDSQKFSEIPTPFITQISSDRHATIFFTVVKEIGQQTVCFFNPEKHKWERTATDNFLKICRGIALLAEAGEGAGEKDYGQKILKERNRLMARYGVAFCLPALFVAAAWLAFSRIGMQAILPFIFSLTALAGTITGMLLLWYELDQHNPLLQQICSYGKKVNCGAVLRSRRAKIAGISWSHIGLCYFAGMLLLLLFAGIANAGALFVLACCATAAVPYVFFSLFYQWKVTKQWCALCLFVQLLIAVQFATVIAGGWLRGTTAFVTPLVLIQSLVAFCIPFIMSFILIPALQKAGERRFFHTELQKLKHNRQIFNALLLNQKKITVPADGLGIALGNPDARIKIIKVCNPYCRPCAMAHRPIEEILDNNADVGVQILFTATNSEGDFRTPPVKHLLAIAESNNEAVIRQSLDDWYLSDTNDYGRFAAKYPMNGELNRQHVRIEGMQRWCESVQIDFTPTFFISIGETGSRQDASYYQLPAMYHIDDLKYFLAV